MEPIRRAYLIADILDMKLANMIDNNEEYFLCNYSREEIIEVINGLREYILCCEGNPNDKVKKMQMEYPLTPEEALKFKKGMTRGELMNYLTSEAKKFRKDTHAISRNKHLTGLSEDPDSKIVDAVLVAFINHVGASQCMDYGLRVNDLDKR